VVKKKPRLLLLLPLLRHLLLLLPLLMRSLLTLLLLPLPLLLLPLQPLLLLLRHQLTRSNCNCDLLETAKAVIKNRPSGRFFMNA
jgi:hypothetical protein